MSRSAVVFDICGTLADTSHREHHLMKHPKDWDSFNAAMHLDTLYINIFTLLLVLFDAGQSIVLSTGRGEETKHATVNWLDQYNIPYHAMYMRPLGDRRDDTYIKREHLELMRADGFSPWLVVENRNRLVRMFRGQGLTCLQCAEGDF